MFSNIGIGGLLIIAALVLVLFGRGKISEIMGDVGKGINSFKKGIGDDDNAGGSSSAPQQIEGKSSVGSDNVTNKTHDNA
ncbi:twin-arginine translocase TatA/TatE family subunit [Parasphingorhabdus sp. DH2-15]|jgi:sec-independent protein translocase protein TatA|uniref:twin-arginine translocase TatA/TatE family subunit n=1 Tax=Parasphingorhabdus sp. DH2-15 TaxID=3444112 RepID=UPI003F6857C1